jgi:hypothetical protein
MIRKGDLETITLWLSLFNLYRYLESKHRFSEKQFETITSPGVGWLPSNDFYGALDHFWDALRKLMPTKRLPKLVPTTPHLFDKVSVTITKAMEIKGSSLYACITSIWTWRALAVLTATPKGFRKGGELFGKDWGFMSNLFPALSSVAMSTAPWLGTMLLGSIWPQKATYVDSHEYDYRRDLGWRRRPKTTVSTEASSPVDIRKSPRESWLPTFVDISYIYKLGRLVRLKEAAGKIRVIAIVDPITQWVLKPVHDWLFNILSYIPQDGTFNQEKPIRKLWKANGPYLGSCDMSAATDRLPVRLQAAILTAVLGPTLATKWMQLLVYRPYFAGAVQLFYAVGQPMGALSSWAALAITHHFLWQWAAYRSKIVKPGQWYKDYAVLGDDSVSAHKAVCDEYLKLCAEIGVKVNLAKSLLSPNGCLEFAKRFFTTKGDASPVSIGEIFVSDINFSTMAGWPRKRTIRIADLINLMGYRHKTAGALNKELTKLPKKVRHMIIVQRSPWGPTPTSGLVEWLGLTRWGESAGLPPRVYPMYGMMLWVGRLRKKVKEILKRNSIPFETGKLTGNWKSEKQLTHARDVDMKTLRSIQAVIYEPVRVQLVKEAEILRERCEELHESLMLSYKSRNTEIIDTYWKQVLRLEEAILNLTPHVHHQTVEDRFVMSSPRQVVKLWNSLGATLSDTFKLQPTDVRQKRPIKATVEGVADKVRTREGVRKWEMRIRNRRTSNLFTAYANADTKTRLKMMDAFLPKKVVDAWHDGPSSSHDVRDDHVQHEAWKKWSPDAPSKESPKPTDQPNVPKGPKDSPSGTNSVDKKSWVREMFPEDTFGRYSRDKTKTGPLPDFKMGEIPNPKIYKETKDGWVKRSDEEVKANKPTKKPEVSKENLGHSGIHQKTGSWVKTKEGFTFVKASEDKSNINPQPDLAPKVETPKRKSYRELKAAWIQRWRDKGK